jgi:hypothetical protein
MIHFLYFFSLCDVCRTILDAENLPQDCVSTPHSAVLDEDVTTLVDCCCKAKTHTSVNRQRPSLNSPFYWTVSATSGHHSGNPDIPGLSIRKVELWFSSRYALKPLMPQPFYYCRRHAGPIPVPVTVKSKCVPLRT